MPNPHNLTEHQKRLRLYSIVCSSLAAVMALCWQFEIISIVIAMPLTAALLISGALLYGRMCDIGISRAKDRKSQTEAAKGSSG